MEGRIVDMNQPWYQPQNDKWWIKTKGLKKNNTVTGNEMDSDKLAGHKNYSNAEKVKFAQEYFLSSWNKGIVPYVFDSKSYDDILKKRVRKAMDYLERVSCVQFKPLDAPPTDDRLWMNITNPNRERECKHDRETSGSQIKVILGFDCLKYSEVLHSLLHGIGFNDQITHPERDEYVRVLWSNIQPKYRKLYAIIEDYMGSFSEYDPLSIMQFHNRAYSINGRPTVVPVIQGMRIQPSSSLSMQDKVKLRWIFGFECNRRAVDNILDTCKTVMKKDETNNNNIDKKHNNAQDIAQISKESTENDAERSKEKQR